MSDNAMQTLNPDIQSVIARWPDAAQRHLLAARARFLDVCAAADAGPLDESLKWGQPAWSPRTPRTGSTLRLNWSPQRPDALAAFVDCKTDLASEMSTRFPDQFHNDGRRSLVFELQTPLPSTAIDQLAYLTFTYHARKA